MEVYASHWLRWGRRRALLISLAAAVTATLAGGLLAGCGGQSATTAGGSRASVLNVVNAWEYAGGGGWDPRAAGSNQVCFMANMYETLVRINPAGSPQPISPLLATSWNGTKAGRVWTFHLRNDVKFHDGQPLTAAAVKYSIESTKTLGEGSAYILEPIKSIKVIDDLTVQFNLSYAAPLDRILGSEYSAYIFSPATKGEPTKWWAGKSYGTGPYKIVSYQSGQQYTYERFADYWGGWNDNQYEKIVVRVVPEALTQRQLLESGEAAFAYQVDRDTLGSIPGGLSAVRVPSYYQYNVPLNTGRAPLDNVKVRQALAWALPYDDILKVAVNGEGTLAVGPIPAGLYPHDGNLSVYSQDLEKAKALLAEAGYPGGKGIHPLKLTYFSETDIAGKAAPLVKEAWKALGIEVNIQPLLTNQVEAVATGAPDKRQDVMVDRQWPSYPDGYDMLWYQWHSQQPVGYNWSYWSSPQTDRLMDEAYSMEMTNPTKAQALYDKCQELLVQNVPSIPLFDMTDVFLKTDSIKLNNGALNQNYPMVLFWYDIRPT